MPTTSHKLVMSKKSKTEKREKKKDVKVKKHRKDHHSKKHKNNIDISRQDVKSKANINQINEDDYFSKSEEFRVWLKLLMQW